MYQFTRSRLGPSLQGQISSQIRNRSGEPVSAHCAMASQQLKELNARSAPVQQYDVCVFHPRAHDYTYTDKKTKATKKSSVFRCLLVSKQNCEQYVVANVQRADRTVIDKTAAKFKEHLCFRMSKTRIKGGTKQEYMHTPLKIVVDIEGTKFDPLLQTGDVTQLAPQPPMSVADCVGYKETQRFDVTALVARLSESRQVALGRLVRDVFLVDGSKLKNGKTAELKLSFYYDSGSSDEAMLKDAEGHAKPLSFFAVYGKSVEKGFKFETSADFFLAAACIANGKGKRLAETAEAVHATPQPDRETLETTFTPDKDYTAELGTETFCSLLRGLESRANVKAIDESPTVWQVNWAEVEWPTGPSVCTKGGERLWFQSSIRDVSGTKSNVWMNESSALALSGQTDKETFMKTWESGDQAFPILASVKLVRTFQKGDKGEKGEDANLTNLTIIQACEQPFDEPPTQATVNLVNLHQDAANDTSCILPAALHMVQDSACYAFQVEQEQHKMPCQKIVALIISTEKTKTVPLGEKGFRLTTSNVQCAMASDDAHLASRYTLSASCTLESLPSYRLDPVRGKPQHALVTITAKVDDAFILDQVQLIDEESALKAKASMKALLSLAMHLKSRDAKRAIIWTETSSPASAKKCRTLGRSATDAPIS